LPVMKHANEHRIVINVSRLKLCHCRCNGLNSIIYRAAFLYYCVITGRGLPRYRQPSHAIRFRLERRVLHDRHARPQRVAHPPGPLLHHVCQFVPDQPQPV
jgi:hypothetical protein